VSVYNNVRANITAQQFGQGGNVSLVNGGIRVRSRQIDGSCSVLCWLTNRRVGNSGGDRPQSAPDVVVLDADDHVLVAEGDVT